MKFTWYKHEAFDKNEVFIIVTPSHHEVLIHSFIRFFKRKKIILITTKEFFSKIENIDPNSLEFINEVNIVNFKNEKLILHTVNKLFYFNKNVLLVIPTIRSSWRLFEKLIYKYPALVCIHNIYFWTFFTENISSTIKKIKTILVEKIFYNYRRENMSKILSNAKYINLHNPLLSSNRLINFSNKIIYMPFKLSKDSSFKYYFSKNKSFSDINIGILCELGSNRKDIMRSIKMLTNVSIFLEDINLIISIAGQCVNNKLWESKLSEINNFTKGKNIKINVLTSNKKLDHEKIINWSQNIDVLMSVSNENNNKPFWGFNEEYGISTSSGICYDAIELGKRVLIDIRDEVFLGFQKIAYLFDKFNLRTLEEAIIQIHIDKKQF